MLVLKSFLIAIMTALVVWYVKFRWDRRHLYKLAAKIQGPQGLPLFGVALSFLGKNSEDTFKQIIALASKFTTPNKFWFGYVCVVAISEPEDLQVVLNSQDAIDKSLVYKKILGKGLLVDSGDLWRSHRKLLSPSFYPVILQSFLPIFNEKARMLVKVLANHLNKGLIDVYRPLSGCTLEAILSTSIGLEKDIQNDPNNWFLDCMEIGTKIISERIFKIWLHFKPLYIFTNLYKMEMKYVKNGMYAIADPVLKEKEYQYKTKTISEDQLNENVDDGSGIKKPQIFIDQLIKMKDNFTLEEIKNEINTFLIAGFETVAVTLSTTLLMVALHPDVQEKLIQELEDVFDSVDQETDDEIINKLPYSEMVIKETLRLYPVGAILGREATKNIQLKSCTIPAGANILLNVFHVQRNPKFWGNNAHLFNPDRFLPENIIKIHPYAYVPFSKGPRNCIGMKYAMNIMKIILSHILRSYKVTTNLKSEDFVINVAFTLKIVQGYMIKLEKREFK